MRGLVCTTENVYIYKITCPEGWAGKGHLRDLNRSDKKQYNIGSEIGDPVPRMMLEIWGFKIYELNYEY
jgi:hypothetical protein